MYYIAVFKSKNHAMNIFYALESKFPSLRLISTPAKISGGGCSFSIRFDDLNKLKYFKDVNKNVGEVIFAIYQVERSKKKDLYKEIDITI